MTKEIDADLLMLQRVRDVVKRAKEAQKEFETFSQERVDKVVQAMAEAADREAESLARMAVEETGYGIVEHKVIKNHFASRDVYESIKNVKTVGVTREDKEHKIYEAVSPYGVIAAIIPSTNPTSTAINKCLIAVKARNGIVISPHPSASDCTTRAAEVCANAAYAAGAPRGLIGWLEKPTMEATESLMHHRDVDLILATGGSGLVRAAYSAGKPAYGVGPGNVPVYIESSAEIGKSVARIIASKTFDNGTICASEQAVVVDRKIKEEVVRAFESQGSYFLSPSDKEAVANVLFPNGGRINSGAVGRDAKYIASLAGIHVPENTRVLISEEVEVGKHVPLSREKLSTVLAFYTVEDWEDGCKTCLKLLDLGGRGHTLVIHSTDDHIIQEFFIQKPVSRILVNTPAALGAIGATTNLRPSMTLGCGSFGGNITSDNISVEHLMNTKRLAYETSEFKGSEPSPASELGTHSREEIINAVFEEINPLAGKYSRDEISKIVAEVVTRMKVSV